MAAVQTCGDTLGRGCFRTLPLDEFHRKERGNDERRELLCKECHNARQREWREENPERSAANSRRNNRQTRDNATERERWRSKADRINARRRDLYANDPAHRERRLATNRRARAKKRREQADD